MLTEGQSAAELNPDECEPSATKAFSHSVGQCSPTSAGNTSIEVVCLKDLVEQ